MSIASILILSTNAGSGHRSAARALQAAFVHRYGAAAHVTICNPWQHPAASGLLRWYERTYVGALQHAPWLYQLGYTLSQMPLTRHALDIWLQYVQVPLLRRVLRDHPADLVVSVYPRLTAAIAASQQPIATPHPRLLTVVTDLADLHPAWFSDRDDGCIVPTHAARRYAIASGLDPQRVYMIGIPVDAAFGAVPADIAALRHALGWQINIPTLLLVGGGAGAGQLAVLAQALDALRLPLQLIIVTGTNVALATQLRARQWRIPVRIYEQVPLAPLMHAVDMVATKAGGLTISEALAAGKPLVIHSAASGQEAGNAQYVHTSGGGHWARTPDACVAQVANWLINPRSLADASVVSRRLGCPNAADQIAQVGWHLLSTRPSVVREAVTGIDRSASLHRLRS